MLQQVAKHGHWVILQNCLTFFLKDLEKLTVCPHHDFKVLLKVINHLQSNYFQHHLKYVQNTLHVLMSRFCKESWIYSDWNWSTCFIWVIHIEIIDKFIFKEICCPLSETWNLISTFWKNFNSDVCIIFVERKELILVFKCWLHHKYTLVNITNKYVKHNKVLYLTKMVAFKFNKLRGNDLYRFYKKIQYKSFLGFNTP